MQGEHPSPGQPNRPVNHSVLLSAAKKVFLAYLDDLEKGEERLAIAAGTFISKVTFSTDGTALAGVVNGKVLVWRADPLR